MALFCSQHLVHCGSDPCSIITQSRNHKKMQHGHTLSNETCPKRDGVLLESNRRHYRIQNYHGHVAAHHLDPKLSCHSRLVFSMNRSIQDRTSSAFESNAGKTIHVINIVIRVIEQIRAASVLLCVSTRDSIYASGTCSRIHLVR